MSVGYATAAAIPISEKWGNKEACLCIHGFCSVPGLYRPLAPDIRAAGYDLYAPLLSGHGTQPVDMLAVTAEQWQEDSRRALEPLLSAYEKVHLIGTSMGGALATYLAGCYGDTGKLGKLLLMVPGYRLYNQGFYQLDFRRCGRMAIPLNKALAIPPELAESAFVYDFVYVRCIGELLRLGQLCQSYIPQVKSPVWLLYALRDQEVDPACCREAAESFPHLVQAQAYEQSGHQLLLDCQREEVYAKIREFLRA